MAKPVIFAIGPEFLARDGLTETVRPWEDGLRAEPVRGTFEWWYFDAHFDDGMTAVIVFATKPIIHPGAPLTPNLSLTITRPDGRKTAEFDLPPAAEFSASKEACDVRLGASWVRWSEEDSRWTYRLHAETRTMAADLTFRGLVPPWRPGAGKSYFGDLKRYFAWLPAIPYGLVEGTLTYDGQPRAVRGSGYHDHNWGNVALPSVMDHWTWGRAHIGEYTLIFVEQVALKRYGSARIPVFLLAKGSHILADDARFLTMTARRFIRHAEAARTPRSWTSPGRAAANRSGWRCGSRASSRRLAFCGRFRLGCVIWRGSWPIRITFVSMRRSIWKSAWRGCKSLSRGRRCTK